MGLPSKRENRQAHWARLLKHVSVAEGRWSKVSVLRSHQQEKGALGWSGDRLQRGHHWTQLASNFKLFISPQLYQNRSIDIRLSDWLVGCFVCGPHSVQKRACYIQEMLQAQLQGRKRPCSETGENYDQLRLPHGARVADVLSSWGVEQKHAWQPALRELCRRRLDAETMIASDTVRPVEPVVTEFLWQAKDFVDIEIVLNQSTVFPVHSPVLRARSSKFALYGVVTGVVKSQKPPSASHAKIQPRTTCRIPCRTGWFC